MVTFPNDLINAVTQKIVGTADKAALLLAIHDVIMPHLQVESASLYIIDEAENYHYDLCLIGPSVMRSETEKNGFSYIPINKITHAGTLVDHHFAVLKETKTPAIFDFESGLKEFPHPYSDRILEAGFKETYAALLLAGNKPFGIFYIYTKERGGLDNINKGLLQQLADLVGIALANIIAREEILAREHEKTQLLTISEAIASVQNSQQLLKVIYEKIQPVFSYERAALFILNTENDSIYEVVSTEKDTAPDPMQLPLSIPLSSLSANFCFFYNEPKITNAVEQAGYSDNTANTVPFASWTNGGIRDMICGPLICGGKKIGMLCFGIRETGNYHQKHLALFKSISDLVAVAVANILANEEIIEREREKSRQLEILEVLNHCSSWNDKFLAVATQFDDFIGCDLFSYSIRLNDGKRIGKGFRRDPELGIFKAKELEEYLQDMKISELEYRQLYNEAMTFFSGSSFYCGEDLDAAIREFALLEKSMGAYGSRSMMFTEKSFPRGSILFILTTQKEQHYNKKTLRFLEATAQQMTLSVMNLLDNEEVADREKQKTLEIEVNNAVLANEDFANVMKGIAESIGTAVGCDICYIRVMSEQVDPKPFHFFCEKIDGNYTVKPVDKKVADTGTSLSQAAKNASEFLTTIRKPTILSGMELTTQVPRYQYLQIFTDKIGIKSFIFLPLQLKYNCTAYLILGSRTAYAYVDTDLAMISNIKTQLSLALDNRLALHQINRLKEMLETENLYLQEAINENYNFNEMVGTSPALQTVFTQTGMVAATDTTVLISGETGTGKELIARAIHNLSHRKDKIMVKVNCACLPAQLIESELFGHEKGAFTGAVEKRIGKFELANGGTIFLDEIGELPLELQAKLLRVIQEREFERIGGRTILKTDIRIIAATNKDLETESREKRFRSDLYYRLNVFPIQLPALKERKEDIPLLALHFAKKFGQKMRKNITAITNDALREMIHYDWPGNIRELEHVVEHSVISSKSSKLSLAKPLLTNKAAAAKSITEFRIKTLNDNEREHIFAILKYCNGRIRGNGGAAQLLDIHPNTLESRMLKLGIRKEHVLS